MQKIPEDLVATQWFTCCQETLRFARAMKSPYRVRYFKGNPVRRKFLLPERRRLCSWIYCSTKTRTLLHQITITDTTSNINSAPYFPCTCSQLQLLHFTVQIWLPNHQATHILHILDWIHQEYTARVRPERDEGGGCSPVLCLVESRIVIILLLINL